MFRENKLMDIIYPLLILSKNIRSLLMKKNIYELFVLISIHEYSHFFLILNKII